MVFDLAAKDADEMLWDHFLDPFQHTSTGRRPSFRRLKSPNFAKVLRKLQARARIIETKLPPPRAKLPSEPNAYCLLLFTAVYNQEAGVDR